MLRIFYGTGGTKLLESVACLKKNGALNHQYFEVSQAILNSDFAIGLASPRRHLMSTLDQRQSRHYVTKIRSPLTSNEFYNRKREIKAFKDVLDNEPQLSLVSGPVNSGKTSLLLYILNELSENGNRPVLHLDLRERSFVTVNEFAIVMEESMKSWLNRFTEIASQLKLTIPSMGKIEFQNNPLRASPIERLNTVFEKMSELLPTQSIWTGKQSPILFIDEANKLNFLLRDKDGNEALHNLFEWFVKNTKQEHRFHVILGASDSFFNLWVAKRVGPSRLVNYVVGDLSREEAENFWKEKVITKLNSSGSENLPTFDHAYEVCGGNMFLLKKYFSEDRRAERRILPVEFSLVRAERTHLLNAFWKSRPIDYQTSSTKPFFDLFETSTPKERVFENGNTEYSNWTQNQFIHVITKLVESENHFLAYDSLCVEVGQGVVDALINENILHLRPTNNYAYDIPTFPIDEAIVTAETPASLLAMRRLLEKYNKGELTPPKG